MEHKCEFHRQLESQIEQNKKDIAELDKRTTNQNILQARMEIKLDNVINALEKFEKSINELIQAPAQRWNSLVSTVIGVIISGVVGFAISRIFF